MEFKTDALVIKATDYKENDKLLNLFTPSRGKLTAGIRGVRKPKAKLAFAAQPFCFAEYVLAEKGGRYTVTAAYLYDGFFALRTDIVRYYAACAVLEICDALLVEEGESRALFIAGGRGVEGDCRSRTETRRSCLWGSAWRLFTKRATCWIWTAAASAAAK